MRVQIVQTNKQQRREENQLNVLLATCFQFQSGLRKYGKLQLLYRDIGKNFGNRQKSKNV